MLMVVKLGNKLIYNDELPSIKSQGPLMACLTRSREKSDLLYLYHHSLWSPRLARWWLTKRTFYP